MTGKLAKNFPTLVDLVRERAQTLGDARAFTYLTDGEAAEIYLSYTELDRQGRAVAAYLQQVAKRGDRAVLIYPYGLDSIPAFCGCLYAGIVAVPCRPPRPNQAPNDLLAVMADAQVSLVLTTSRSLPLVKPLLEHLPDCKVVATDEISESLADAWKPLALKSDDLAALQYTSGSTKSPRGIGLSHHHLFGSFNTEIVKLPGLQGERPFVSWVPLQATLGLLNGMLAPLYEGEHSVLMSPLDFTMKPVRWLRAISHYHGVSSGGPNFAYQLCVDRVPLEACEGLRLDSWLVINSGGEPIRASTMNAFARKFAPFGLHSDKFLFSYGLSEAIGVASRHGQIVSVALDRSALERNETVETAPGAPGAQTFVSCGVPYEGEKILLVDPNSLVERAPNQIGEIWVQSSTVALGYLNQPEETQAIFRAYLANGDGPFLRTGDLGFLKDGELYITGRIKDVIILHGRNIYAQDIEQTAEQAHSALQPGASAAFSVTINDEEQLAIALEVRAGKADLDVDDISRAVRRAIADEYQMPVHTVALLAPNSLPRTAAGKVRRFMARNDLMKQIQP